MSEILNIKETNDLLKQLRNLDLKTVGKEQIKDLLRKLYRHIGVNHSLRKGQYIQRIVLLDDEVDDFFPKDSGRLSYNPYGSAMGRCNFEGESIFYGAIDSEVIRAYDCVAMETLPLDLVGIRQHRFVTGNWILQEDIEMPFIGGASNLTYLSKAGKERHQVFNEVLRNYKEDVLSLYSIDKFICEQFSKEVQKHEPWQYKISASYVELLKEYGNKGLVYPSVKCGGAGTNLMFFKEDVDNEMIIFDKCAYGVCYVRDDQTVNEYLMNAKEQNGILEWKDDYTGRIHHSIREYYKGHTNINPLANSVPIIDFGVPSTAK